MKWFWIALDAIGHEIPLLRFGRVRYAICLKRCRAQGWDV